MASTICQLCRICLVDKTRNSISIDYKYNEDIKIICPACPRKRLSFLHGIDYVTDKATSGEINGILDYHEQDPDLANVSEVTRTHSVCRECRTVVGGHQKICSCPGEILTLSVGGMKKSNFHRFLKGQYSALTRYEDLGSHSYGDMVAYIMRHDISFPNGSVDMGHILNSDFLSEELLMYCIIKDQSHFKHIPKGELTPTLVNLYFYLYRSLEDIPDEFIDEEKCRAAVKYSSHNMQFVPVRINNDDIINEGIETHFDALSYLSNERITYDRCLLAASIHPNACQFIPIHFRDEKMRDVVVKSAVEKVTNMMRDCANNYDPFGAFHKSN